MWSPDGRWIAFSSNATGTMQLWKMPSSGGDAVMLITGYERMYHPFYSPDGKWIYIQPGHRNICRVPSEGGKLQPVTKFPESGLFIEEQLFPRTEGGSRTRGATAGRRCGC